MKCHRVHAKAKTFGMRLAEAGKHIGSFLDKELHVAHQAVSHISPELVDTVAGPEYGAALRHTKTALQGYETARAIATGGRR